MRDGRWGIAYVNNVGGANVIKDVGHLLIIRPRLQRGRAHPMRTHVLRRTVWSLRNPSKLVLCAHASAQEPKVAHHREPARRRLPTARGPGQRGLRGTHQHRRLRSRERGGGGGLGHDGGRRRRCRGLERHRGAQRHGAAARLHERQR